MGIELRFALRTLTRWGGAIPAILTLGIGIAATTSLYALTRWGLADFPGIPQLERVARVYGFATEGGSGRTPISLSDYESTLSRTTSFVAVGAYAQDDVTMGSNDDAHPVTAGFATPSFFDAVSVAPQTGRLFTTADGASSAPVVVVSEGVWRSRFADRRFGEASVLVDGVDRLIVGVMPSDFHYPFIGITADLWLPLAQADRGASAVTVYARLRSDLSWSAAAAELSALRRPQAQRIWRAIPLRDDARHRATGALLFTLGPAVLVLLIGCTNVSCILLARGVRREAELTVRCALGATRARVVRQLFTENVLLALAGGALGSGLAVAILRVVQSDVAAVQPRMAARLSSGAFDLLTPAILATVISCVLFGTIPAMRLSKLDIAASLNGVPARYRVHIARYGARDLVVFFETACAVGLMVFAGLIFTLFGELERVAPTFSADQILAVRVAATDADVIERRLAVLPGVEATSRVSAIPGTMAERRRSVQVEIPSGGTVVVSRIAADSSLFRTIGLPILRGRSFSRTEVGDAAGVMVLSEAAARALTPNRDPLGVSLRFLDARSSLVVIGVCRDAMNYGSLARAGLAPLEIYVPDTLAQTGETFLLVRAIGDSHRLVRPIAAAAQMSPGSRPPKPWVVGKNPHLRDAGVDLVVWKTFGAFCLISVLLASSGVYGVISQSVAQRTREFGIRLALGAAPQRLLRMVLAREGKLIIAALACGSAFTFGTTRAAFAELVTLAATSPALWAAAVALCATFAAGSLYLATRRIVRLDPLVVLRRN